MNKFIYFVMLLKLLVLTTFIFGQPEQQSTISTLASVKKTAKTANELEKTKLVVSSSFDDFRRELNELGKSGYKIEKSLNFGGTGVSQEFAAFLTLDEGNLYQYEWLSSPNKNFIESRLNYKAQTGFSFVNSFALTVCGEDDEPDTNPSTNIFNFTKGDVFLLVKKNNIESQTKEYKVIIGKIGMGKSPTQELQTALDNLPPGFRPVKILFNKSGLLDFAVSILLERNPPNEDAPKIEYKFIKEVNGFEKEVNSFAAQGFRIISGRRIGLIKFVVMIKESAVPTVYTLIDEEKQIKEFDDTVGLGNSYQGILLGDMGCDSQKKIGERLFFTKNSAAVKHDYKVIQFDKSGDTVTELKRLETENYHIRDLFYFKGLNIIFEK